MSGKIFINYRRDDDPNGAARVRDGLTAKFGRNSVFMDVDNLLAGQRFDEELAKALAQCDVLLAIIGPRWMDILQARMAGGERDYVQEEIAEALKRKIVVIPVLVGRDRNMPSIPRREDLPDDIRDLVYYQKHDVAYERFGRDIAELNAAISTVRKTNRQPLAAPVVRGRWLAAASIGALGAGLAWAYFSGVPIPWPDSAPQPASETADATRVRADETEQARAAARAAAAAEDRNRERAAAAAREALLKAEQARLNAAAETKRKAEAAAAANKAREQAPPAPIPLVRAERKFRLASSFPKSLKELHEPGLEFARELGGISASKLKVDVFSAGEIVPPLQVLDAVKSGTIEMGWTYAGYYTAKDAALSIAAGGIPVGKSASTYLSWLRGEGRDPRDELFASLGVKAIPCSIVGPQGLWLKKSLTGVADLRGMKLRAGSGLGPALSALGAVPMILPGGEIYPAMERGLIDGFVWLTPAADEQLGFHKVARNYFYPIAEPTFSSITDLLVGLPVWSAMEPAARDAIELACTRQLTKDSKALLDGADATLKKFVSLGTTVRPLPKTIVAALQDAAIQSADKAITSAPGRAVWNSLKNAR